MTLNEVNIIKNSVLDATEAYVDARLNSSDFVKTQIGVTSGNPTEGTDGKYRHTVVCNKTAYTAGVTYTNVLSVGNVKFPPNSVVFLIAPNAQYSNQFILGKLDNTPANIVGGTIKIGRIGNTDEYYFNVDDGGKVTIKKGSINIADKFYVNDTGNLYLGGTTTSSANFYVTNTGKVTIKSGSITLSNAFKVDETGWLAIGGTTSSANFYVDTTGAVTIKKGSMTIGSKFKIDTSGNLSIGGTSSSANFYVQASDGAVTIKKGSMTIGSVFHIDSAGWLSVGGTTSSANFYVDTTGSVTIKKGSMTIGSNFKIDTSGNLSIGGTTSAANFYVQASDGSVTIKKGSINIANKFYTDNTGNLYVGGTTTSSAKFYVTNAGYLNSTSGKIGGFDISSTDLKIEDAVLSKEVIGCGKAGDGIVNLVGGNNDAYIQISDDGSPTTNTNGIRIYQNGRITSTLGTGWNTKYFKNIPDQEIWEDSAGYLHFAD